MGGLLKLLGDGAGALGFKHAVKGGVVRKGKKKAKKGGAGKKKGGKNAKKKAVRRGQTKAPNTVFAANAPIAFARTDDLRPSFRTYQSDMKDGTIIHAVDFVGNIGTFAATAGNWSNLQTYYLGPGNTILHPWMSNIAPLFQKYKLRFLRLHYQHYVATTVPGEVVLQFFPDANFNNGNMLGVTQPISQNCSNYTSGSVYEDFCHTADLRGIDPYKWFDTETSLATAEGEDQIYAGLVALFGVNAASSQASTGNFWIETVYEFYERKTSSVTVGLSKARAVINNRNIPAEKKKQWLHRAVDELVAEVERKPMARVDPIAEMVNKGLDSATSGMSSLRLIG